MIEAIDSGWVSSLGPFIKKFESRFSEYTDIPFCSSCSNGTSALHLALRALNIGPGDKVGLPSFTYVATANAVKYVGAEPVLFDVGISSWNLALDEVTDLELKELSCMILVDVYGAPSITRKQFERLRRHRVLIVNDCAESLGSYIEDLHVGHFCDIATFSFFGNKTLTTGEGGMVATHSLELYEKVNMLKNQGRLEDPYFHYDLGYNYRMTNIQAALGFSQFSRLDETLKKKAELYEFYWENFYSLGMVCQELYSVSISSYWICAFLFSDPDQLKKTRKYLSEQKIETRPFFTPVENFPMYQKPFHSKNSQTLSKLGLCLPSYPNLSRKDREYIVEMVKKTFA